MGRQWLIHDYTLLDNLCSKWEGCHLPMKRAGSGSMHLTDIGGRIYYKILQGRADMEETVTKITNNFKVWNLLNKCQGKSGLGNRIYHKIWRRRPDIHVGGKVYHTCKVNSEDEFWEVEYIIEMTKVRSCM